VELQIYEALLTINGNSKAAKCGISSLLSAPRLNDLGMSLEADQYQPIMPMRAPSSGVFTTTIGG